MQLQQRPVRLYLGLLATIGWLGLIVQFYLIFANRVASIPETFIRYFSFFTILTNLLVAVCCTVLSSNKNSRLYRFFSKQQSLASITVYIIVVGLVYHVILKRTWNPEGLHKIASETLHTVTPLMFLFFWLRFAPKDQLSFRNIFGWLIYPAVYAAYVLFRGSFSGFYPYPFINYATLGLQKVTTNILILIVVFVIFSLLFVSIGKLMSRSQRQISETY